MMLTLSWYAVMGEATDNITQPETSEPTDTGKWKVAWAINLFV